MSSYYQSCDRKSHKFEFPITEKNIQIYESIQNFLKSNSINEYYEEEYIFVPSRQPTNLEAVQHWIQTQKYIPDAITDQFLQLFLHVCDGDPVLAAIMIYKYFIVRQEFDYLYTDWNKLTEETRLLHTNVFVLPLPSTTENYKVILTGLVHKHLEEYNKLDHLRMLALTFDVLVNDIDVGLGEVIIIFDCGGFLEHHFMQQKLLDHTFISQQILSSTPFRLRNYYLLNPPEYMEQIIDIHDGLWFHVIKDKESLRRIISPDILPLEYGGNVGHLDDVLHQWHTRLIDLKDWFAYEDVNKKNDVRRRLCHEEELSKGPNWVYKMQLYSEESDFKRRYYEGIIRRKVSLRNGFGELRQAPVEKPLSLHFDPLREARKKVRKSSDDFMETCLNKKYLRPQSKSNICSKPRLCLQI